MLRVQSSYSFLFIAAFAGCSSLNPSFQEIFGPGVWQNQGDVRAATRELDKVAEQSQPEFALQKCRSALADPRPADPSIWCTLAYRSSHGAATGREESTLAAAWVEMLEGQLWGQPIASLQGLALGGTESLRVRRWTYSTISLARINRGLESEAYRSLAAAVGIKALSQPGMHEQRVVILNKLVGKPLRGDDLWVAATIAATHRYNFNRDPPLDASTYKARVTELLYLLNRLSYDAVELDRVDRSAVVILDRARAELLDSVDRPAAAQLRAATAQTCGTLLWSNADICRDSRYRTAIDAAQEEAYRRHPERRKLVAEKKVIRPDRIEGQVKHEAAGPTEPCRAVYLVDLTAQGSLTNLREFYSDPPRACTKAASSYFASLRYREQSNERPDEERVDVVQPFVQITW